MTPMEPALSSFESAANFYCRDLEALTEDQILCCAGGSARCPVNFTYEVAFINRQVAARLAGVEPTPSPEGDEWVVAPEELRSKEAISAYMRSACDEVLAAAKAVPEDEIGKMIGSPGRERPAYAIVNFAAMHTMYHDAQLNFIQCLGGDSSMHWF